jgi:hypothetical protein
MGAIFNSSHDSRMKRSGSTTIPAQIDNRRGLSATLASATGQIFQPGSYMVYGRYPRNRSIVWVAGSTSTANPARGRKSSSCYRAWHQPRMPRPSTGRACGSASRKRGVYVDREANRLSLALFGTLLLRRVSALGVPVRGRRTIRRRSAKQFCLPGRTFA